MENSETNPSARKAFIDQEHLQIFFVDHLSKIYAAKTHLVQSLPQLVPKAHFSDLEQAIIRSINDAERQLARMEVVFALMDAHITEDTFMGVNGLIDGAFQAVIRYEEDVALRDLSLLFYLQNIESLEMSTFQILQLVAVKLHNRQVVQLLKENFEDAKTDRSLMLMITAKYVISK